MKRGHGWIKPAVVAALGWSASASVRAALFVPAYNSYPSASAQIYLDFDGDVTPTWGTYSPGTTIAYDTDGDPNNFSGQELANIHDIWAGVAEKYSPFNINVTTVDPGALNNFVATNVVIGGSVDWAPAGSGGIAIFQSFVSAQPNVAFVFPGHLVNGTPKYVVESTAHEAGHGFALKHQSTFDALGNKTAEYNPGDADHAPIMGYSYFATRGQWWKGPSTDGPIQDDLALLSAVGTARPNFGYRADDHGSTYAAADPLSLLADFSFTDHGVIEKTSDADYFSFTTPGGVVRLNADVNPYSPMLDLSLSLYDSSGNLITSSATSSLSESIAMALPAGTYEMAITSAGNYGDVGQYRLSGTVVPEPTLPLAGLAFLAGTLRRRR